MKTDVPSYRRHWTMLKSWWPRHWSLIPVLGLGVLVATVVSLQYSAAAQRSTALASAKAYVQTLTLVRDHYASELKEKFASGDVQGHQPFYGPPVAYTLLLDASEHLPSERPSFRVLSQYPWPNRLPRRPLSEIDQNLLDQIVGQQVEAVVLEQKSDGVHSLIYAEPVVMKPQCVSCHNTHPQSPRTGWSVGDIRGVQYAEVSLPGMPLFSSLTSASTGMLGLWFAVVISGYWLLGRFSRKAENSREQEHFLAQTIESMADGVICLD